jgi:type IV pilus assembly protein PilW
MKLKNQAGFSLVELMVSIVLGLILMAGVLSMFFSSKVTYFANEKTARLQENGRVALDFLTHDVRSSGYQGCARGVEVTSTLNDATALLWSYIFPIQGFESDGAGGFAPAMGIVLNPLPVEDSDVIVVRTAMRDGHALRMETDLADLTSPISVLNAVPAPVSAGTVMMISDCNAASVFQVTSWAAGAPNGTIGHAVGGANPGNLSDDLGYLYRTGARVAPLQTVIYYVGIDPDSNQPALFRQTGAAQPAEMLIEGVQALQIAYGEDTNGDRVADGYGAADTVVNWNNIISVTLSMLIRSDESGTNTDANTYSLLTADLGGVTLGPYNDRRQRMTFTTSIALRNRAW